MPRFVTDYAVELDGEVLSAAFWREKDHPRDKDGQFTEGADRFKDAASGKAALKAVPDDSRAPVTAIRTYQAFGDQRINDALRGGDEDTLGDLDATALRELDETFAESRASEDLVVYRGIKDPSSLFGGLFWKPDGDNSGLVWKDRGFTSTTVDRKIGQEFAGSVLMRILVPKGTKAMHLSKSPGLTRDEKEILLNRGLTFRIIKDHGRDPVTRLRNMDVEVVEKTS